LVFLFLACSLPRSVSAQQSDADIARGLTWLQGQIQASGELAAESTSCVLPVQTRFEARQRHARQSNGQNNREENR